jgi:hypothetical protein
MITQHQFATQFLFSFTAAAADDNILLNEKFNNICAE